MSAISDYYVNYHATHYLHNDPNSRNKAYLTTYSQRRLLEQAARLKTNVSDEAKAQYKDLLNGLMSRNDLLKDLAPQIQDAIANVLQDRFGKIADLIIDIQSGSVGRDLSKQFDAYLNKTFKTIDNKYFISRQRFDKLLSIYLEALQAAKDGILNKNNLQTLDKAITETENIQKELSKLKSIKLENITDPKAKFILTGLQSRFNTDWFTINAAAADGQSLISKINELIQSINGIASVAAAAQGALFEYVGVAASYLMDKEASDSIDDMVEKIVHDISTQTGLHQGAKTKQITYDAGGMSKELAERLAKLNGKQKVVDIDGKRKIQSSISTQQKIDVLVSIPDEYGKMQIPASFKNYAIHSNMREIGLVSGTDALQLLSNENYDYIRKYLNIMAQHNALSDRKHIHVPRSVEQNSVSTITQQRKDAILSFQLLAIYKALTGDVENRTAAQLFVINDINSKKIEIFEISELIQKLLLSNINNISQYFVFPKTDFNIYYLNKWIEGEPAESAIDRMAKLLHSVHSQKISVGMTYQGLLQAAAAT